MLTNNFIGLLKRGIGTTVNIIEIGGTNKSYPNSYAVKYKAYLGSGTIPAKACDYKLENKIESGYTASIEEKDINIPSSEQTSMYQLVINFTNTSDTNASDENMIINEIGLMVTDSSTNFHDEELYLIAREVFDTPITLAPGETKSFVLKLF